MEIKENVVLSPYSTYRIGGPARFFCVAKSKQELIDSINFAKKNNIKFYIIGSGSNIVFSDKGYNGLIIVNKCSNLEIADNIVKVESGYILASLIKKLYQEGLIGMENLFGIPGTIGGAIYQNAGAYGSEIGEFIETVEILDSENNHKILRNDELEFGYRNSIFKKEPYIILQATLKLNFVNKDCSKDIIDKMANKRIDKPIGKNCGSFFKNPEGNYAGKLIEDAGLKKFRIGGAEVSEKHANYIMNIDNATFDDIINISQEIKKQVNDKFGIMLEEEVRIVPY